MRGTCAIANIAIGDVAEWRIDRSPGPSTRAKRRPALLTAEMVSGRRPWLVAKPVGATSVAEIGLTLSGRDGPLPREAGIAQPDAAVRVNKHVARVDRAMAQPSTVACPQPSEDPFRECRDLSSRQRSDRGEPAQAQPRVEGANQHPRVAVGGDSYDVDERIVTAPSDPSKPSRQLPLRFWTHAQHPLRDADVSCPCPHEPCIAVTAAAEPPQPLHLVDVDLVRDARGAVIEYLAMTANFGWSAY